jgi:hypothetical protein
LYPAILDTADKTQIRLVGYVTVAGAATAALRVGARSDFSATASDYPNAGVTPVTISLATPGYKDTGWIDLAAGAIGSTVYAAVIGSGGDSTTDPRLSQIHIEMK